MASAHSTQIFKINERSDTGVSFTYQIIVDLVADGQPGTDLVAALLPLLGDVLMQEHAIPQLCPGAKHHFSIEKERQQGMDDQSPQCTHFFPLRNATPPIPST